MWSRPIPLVRRLFARRHLLGTAVGLVAAVQVHQFFSAGRAAQAMAISGRTASFGKKSTAKEVVDAFAPNRCLEGRVAVVTGGNSGIGLETVKALASAGCRVVLTSRDTSAGERAVEEEVKQPGLGDYAVPNAEVSIKQLDLSDLGSVVTFANDLLTSEQRLDYVVLNAGVMALPELSRTADGFETQIGVNHFGHALLVRLLRPKLEAQGHKSRVVVLASTAHKMAKQLDVRDLHFRARDGSGYSAWGAYGASKLANVLFAKALAKQMSSEQVAVTSVHPGVIRTPLWRSTPANNAIGGFLLGLFLADKTVPQGASTTLWACLSEEAGRPDFAGTYLSDCGPERASALGRDDGLAEALQRETDAQLDAALAARGLDPMGKPLPASS